MIITCVCGEKKFTLPDNSIPASGRMVKCGFCDKEWKQLPVKKPDTIRKTVPFSVKKTPVPTSKRKGPVPYSKEYMQQKWGSSLKSYAIEKGLTKKTNKIIKPKKIQKEKPVKVIEKPGFGFFNYIIVISILIVAKVGTLDLTKTMIISKFPFLNPYIEHFFETINNLKIFILDFYR